MGKLETVVDFILGSSKITEDGDCSHEIKRCLLLGRKAMKNLDSILKKQKYYFADKGQNCGFSSSHVWMWELDCNESWALKNWCFQIVVLKKTLESPLDCKEIQPVHPKGNQSWIFIGRTDAEAETPILWPLDVNELSNSLMLGKIEGKMRRGWQRMVSLTQWTWVWASSRRWWRTGKPGMLQSMGLQRVRHSLATEQQQWFITEYWI